MMEGSDGEIHQSPQKHCFSVMAKNEVVDIVNIRAYPLLFVTIHKCKQVSDILLFLLCLILLIHMTREAYS